MVTEVKPDFMTQTFTQLYPNYPVPLPKQVGLEMAEEYKMDKRRYKSDIEAFENNSKRMILDLIRCMSDESLYMVGRDEIEYQKV